MCGDTLQLLQHRRAEAAAAAHTGTEVARGITDENTLKTHRVTQSARDIIYPEISGRFNQGLTRNVQGRGIVSKSEQ